ncbi:hypothetical protein [Rhodoblastus sp.]|nr:hypothetical protein [Rhodoblastus sp.]
MTDFDRKPAVPRWGQTRARATAAEIDQGLRADIHASLPWLVAKAAIQEL